MADIDTPIAPIGEKEGPMAEQAIYFEDLSPDAQEKIKETFNTTPEREYWDLFPLVVLKSKKSKEENKE